MTAEPTLVDLLYSRARVDLESLASVALVVEGRMPCSTLERILAGRPELDAVLVRGADSAGDERLGLISRRAFVLLMASAHGFGRSLNYRRPVGDVATCDVAVLAPGSDVAEAAAALVKRAGDRRFEDLVLRGCDGVLRLLPAAAVLEALAAQYLERATHDGLTGLVNRDMLFGCLAEALAVPGQGAVALTYLDMVGLRPINRQFGHDAGDAVLVRVAGALRAAAEPGEVVARVGGDEFAVLTLLPDHEDAADVVAERAQRLVTAVEDAFRDDMLKVRTSVGAAVARPGVPTTDAAGLLRTATNAMYTAQRWGSREVEVVTTEGTPLPA